MMGAIPAEKVNPMSVIQVNHIEANCTARFSLLIDMSDCATMQSGDKKNKFLSRAVAAFAIAALAKVDDATASASVVDEYGDDGIDAYYYDRAEHTVYLAQSKWSVNGNGTIDVGSVLKFTQGVNHLLENKVEMLGPKMKAKGDDIRDALYDSQARFVLVVAYTGTQSLSNEVSEPINSLIDQLNDDADVVSLQVLRQKELHRIVELGAMGSPIDFDIMLREWGKAANPYTVYYGHVDVADLAPWAAFGDRIYTKNIRGFKGNTDVNDAIISTLKTAPEKFLYFNNGITLLCESLDKKMLGGTSRMSGVFECKGASVINGAQTVGSILTWLSSSPPASNISPQILVRLISLKDCPADFANEVTRAANTQNRIQGRDFASLDQEQSRLRSELYLSLNKDYVYKTGEHPPLPEKGCTLEDATIALACSQADVTHAVNAKQAIGRFFEDTSKPPYTTLFNASLTAENVVFRTDASCRRRSFAK